MTDQPQPVTSYLITPVFFTDLPLELLLTESEEPVLDDLEQM